MAKNKIKPNPQDKEKDPNPCLVSQLYNNGLLSWNNYKGLDLNWTQWVSVIVQHWAK